MGVVTSRLTWLGTDWKGVYSLVAATLAVGGIVILLDKISSHGFFSDRSEPDAEELKAYWEILKAEKNRKHEDYDDAPSRFATIPPMHLELR